MFLCWRNREQANCLQCTEKAGESKNTQGLKTVKKVALSTTGQTQGQKFRRANLNASVCVSGREIKVVWASE